MRNVAFQAYACVLGFIAFSARMLVVWMGCAALTVCITGWLELNWRFWTVSGLVLVAYGFASALQYLAEWRIKQIRSKVKSPELLAALRNAKARLMQ